MTSHPMVTTHEDKPYERQFGPDWWLARCKHCKTLLSRYDFTAEEALHNGLAAIAEGEHSCAGTQQLTLANSDA